MITMSRSGKKWDTRVKERKSNRSFVVYWQWEIKSDMSQYNEMRKIGNRKKINTTRRH